MFSSTGSSFGSGNAFSANNNNNSTSGGLFGAKSSIPAAGGFGSTTNNQQSSGLFGNNNQTTSSSNNLFGNNTNSATNSGGLFGNNSTQNNSPSSGLFGNSNSSNAPLQSNTLFGKRTQTQPTGTGLFGGSNTKTTATSGGLFGNNVSTSAGPSGGLFGNSNSQASTSTGLFGNNNVASSTGGLFGNKATNTGIGSSLFGNTQAPTSTGLFGNSTATAQPSGGLFGSNNQSLLGNNNLTPAKQYSVKDLPKSLTDSTKANKTLNNNSRKRSFSSANQSTGPIVNARSSLLDRFSTRFQAETDFSSDGLFSPKKDLIQTALVPEKVTSTTATAPKKLFKSLGSANRRGHQSSFGTDFLKLEVDPNRTEARRLKIFGESGGAQKVKVLGDENEPPVFAVEETSSQSNDHHKENNVIEIETNNVQPTKNTEDHKISEDNIKFSAKDDEYWCSPSIEELSTLSLRQLSEVPDFTIGRKGYGTIHFELPVDLTTFWSDLNGYLFGNIVRFNKNQTVEVYPNGSVPLGTGLNVPATITVEKVFPITKNGRKILDNLTTKDAELRLFIKKLRDLNDMEFVAYDPINGSWTFKVEHFSIWGLVDDDVVVVDMDSVKPKQAKKSSTVEPLSNPQSNHIKADTVQSLPPAKRLQPKSLSEDTFVFRKRRQNTSFEEERFIIPGSFIIDDNEKETVSFQLHRTQNNILEEDESSADENHIISDNEEIPSKFEYGEDSLLDDSIMEFEEKQFEPVDVNEKDFAYLNNEPYLSVSDDWDQQLELSANIDSAFAEGNLKLTTRYDAPFSKPFSASEVDKLLFGDFNEKLKSQKAINQELRIEHYNFVIFSTENGLTIKDPSLDTNVSTKPLSTFFDIQDKSFLTTIYKEHIKQSNILHRKNTFPLISPNRKLNFEFITNAFESHPEFKVSSIWKLASVIFDTQDLSNDIQDIKSSEISARVSDIKRREGLLNWIKTEVKEEIDTKSNLSSDPFEKVFLALVLNNISDASKLAFKSQNPHLSVLVTLLGSNDPEVKYSSGKQLEYWESNSILHTIPINLLKIYYLLKGEPLHSSSAVDVVEGFSWKARLGLLLSYGNLNESLATLLATFIDSDASSEISETDLNQFALLKLFVNEQTNKYNTVEIFTSLNKQNKFDVSLQWYIFALLVRSTKQLSFGNRESTSLIGDKLTLLYAEELISNGLYEEGIFILSHLDNDEQANLSISKLVAVNIEKFSNVHGLIDNLHNVLKVPSKLIIESKALHYRFTGDIWKEASYLLDAQNYEEAHRTIINKVAPAAVINNGPQLKCLEEFISRFPEQHNITDWNLGLLVYKNYIQSVRVNSESSLRYLVENLPNVKQSNFKIKVAVRLMSKNIATKLIEISRSEGSSFMELDSSKVLKLPLGDDAPYFAKDFAIEYFKQILSGV